MLFYQLFTQEWIMWPFVMDGFSCVEFLLQTCVLTLLHCGADGVSDPGAHVR